MPRRLNTVIIVPHSQAKFIKFSFSTRTVMVVGAVVMVAMALSLVAVMYTGSAVKRRTEVASLERENVQLTEVNRQLESSLAEVQSRLDDFEERTARLALAAGMQTDPLVTSERGSSDGRVGTGGPYDRVAESPEVLTVQGEWIDRQLALVEERLATQDEQLSSTPTIAPVAGLLTDGFGRRRDPFTGRHAFHRGLDISARRGTPVVAPGHGIVVFAGRNGGLGKVVKVSHGFGYTTVYGHLDRIDVEPGDQVERGDTIGLLGNTGRSTGPHLHYEVHLDGQAVNPLYYLLDGR
jgi:murein DD-endopeptidase MepM/ murein hydrolase activator NlpD